MIPEIMLERYLADDLSLAEQALEPGEAITVELLGLAEVMNMIREDIGEESKLEKN